MELAAFGTADGTTAAVRTDSGWVALDAPDLSTLLARPDWRALAASTTGDLLAADATPVNPFPTPGKVICCGLNYADHILEMGRELPEYPTLFAKFADTLIGPRDDIVVPPGAQQKVDWEAELAVVIGSEIHRGDEDAAASAIAGYTLANDISIRDWQNRTLQWFQGKAFTGTNPIGPVLVTADALDPTAGLDIRCTVNGVERQHGDTAQLVFGPARLVSYISQFTALRPGDIVLTGTPGGVGMGMTPPVFLSDGDVVVVEADRLGRLENRVRFA